MTLDAQGLLSNVTVIRDTRSACYICDKSF